MVKFRMGPKAVQKAFLLTDKLTAFGTEGAYFVILIVFRYVATGRV